MKKFLFALIITLFLSTTTQAQVHVTPQVCVRSGEIGSLFVEQHYNGINIVLEYTTAIAGTLPFLLPHLAEVAQLPRTANQRTIDIQKTLMSNRAIHDCVHAHLVQE